MAKPRVPTKLKLLQGTFMASEAPKNEPPPDVLTEVPKAPSHLNKWAKLMWNHNASELMALGMITALDTYTLEVLCEQYGIYREMKEAITHIKVDGKKKKISVAQYLSGRNSQTVPEYNAMKSAFESYRGLLKEFGLSPASRSRIDLPVKPADTKDPMEALLEAK